jgi:hypothetical protein
VIKTGVGNERKAFPDLIRSEWHSKKSLQRVVCRFALIGTRLSSFPGTLHIRIEPSLPEMSLPPDYLAPADTCFPLFALHLQFAC